MSWLSMSEGSVQPALHMRDGLLGPKRPPGPFMAAELPDVLRGGLRAEKALPAPYPRDPCHGASGFLPFSSPGVQYGVPGIAPPPCWDMLSASVTFLGAPRSRRLFYSLGRQPVLSTKFQQLRTRRKRSVLETAA